MNPPKIPKKNLLRKLSASLGITLLGVVALTISLGYHYIVEDDSASAIPAELLQNVTKTTVITDKTGGILYYYYRGTNRVIVDGDEIAQVAKDAFIAVEDERFYQHKGLDIISVGRAAYSNYRSKEITSGGSTITMQLVKNLTGDNRQSWQRKAREAYLATKIEARAKKEDILAAYLNVVSLGYDVAGVETASRFYYGKPASKLSLPEAATLAALPASPTLYSSNAQALRQRRDFVIDRMVKTGKISSQEAMEAKAADTPIKQPEISMRHPHFTTYAIDALEKEYGDNLLRLGLTVTGSLDPATQELAQNAVADNLAVLSQVSAQNVGIVSLDPKTGHVMAMVGSKSFDDKENRGEVNFTTAPLSYGSTLKPMIYAMLMEQDHWGPGAIMWDVRTGFAQDGQPPYVPRNYDGGFFGPMTIREALGTSRNVTAIKALTMIGIPEFVDRLNEAGIKSLGSATGYLGPSLAVGGGGIQLIEMAGIYTAFANEGRLNTPQPFIEIKNYKGEIINRPEPSNKQIIKPEVAYEIADILQDNNARSRIFGTRSQLVIPGRKVAAKTGTSEDYRGALTVGFTPEIVTAVIVSNNNNEPLRAGGSGAMAAAPFWHSFMRSFLADRPDVWFEQPETVVATQFRTVRGTITDLTAPWQTPTDRYAKAVAETDNPAWNRAIAGYAKARAKVAEERKKEQEQQAQTASVEVSPAEAAQSAQ